MEALPGQSRRHHVEIERHYYSVPFQLLRQTVEARITTKSVEIFHHGKLVATHLRSLRRHRPSTVPDHMPSYTAAIATGRTSGSGVRRRRQR